MLGKTFKGLTDEMLRWQTEKLLVPRGRAATQWTVHVRPELVVEIAFSDVQESPRYPAGLALRFARVKRYRPDKPAGGGRHHRHGARPLREAARLSSASPGWPLAGEEPAERGPGQKP